MRCDLDPPVVGADSVAQRHHDLEDFDSRFADALIRSGDAGREYSRSLHRMLPEILTVGAAPRLRRRRARESLEVAFGPYLAPAPRGMFAEIVPVNCGCEVVA